MHIYFLLTKELLINLLYFSHIFHTFFYLLTLVLISILTFINLLIVKLLIMLITYENYYRIRKNYVIKLLITMFIIKID